LSKQRSELRNTRRALLGSAAVAATPTVLFGRAVNEARAQDPSAYQPSARHSTLGPSLDGVVAIEPEGSEGIRTWSATSGWSEHPQMRLRISSSRPDPNGGQHLLIGPYQFGMSIEYNGAVECWVNDWSIHNNQQGGDLDPARLWVGNHDDTGGVLITAHRREGRRYGEVVSQLFSRASGGDLRFVVRGTADAWDFRAGAEGLERPVLRVSAQGQMRLAATGDGPPLEIRRNDGEISRPLFTVDAYGAARLHPFAEAAALEVGDPDAAPVLRVTASGQIYARHERVEQVWVGAAGPENQAGIAFGRAGDVRLYRSTSGEARLTGRLVVDGGLAVGIAEPATALGSMTHRLPMFDTRGGLVGYLPVFNA
jgi:hypothetical protein